MSKTMLIDATHPEEVRVAVVDGHRLEEYDSESTSKKNIKGNIYLAKIIRIEPSLQAAFVEYGSNRHGFLPFGEIHPDYYQIPINDREKLLVPVAVEDATDAEAGELFEGDDPIERAPRNPQYRYKIQEVIKRRQILLVQVVKEERANKGAALTTYITFAGRYCVLMPNSGHRTGGIS
ncbi:MAG: ribonuclease E/G, partial [Alphaproteobacteria bacterium]